MSAASAATRASDRNRSSRDARHAIALMRIARSVERNVTAKRVMALPQPEFHGDFDEHVDRHTLSMRRREAPLPDGLYRAFVETGAESLQNSRLADGAVTPDDDFENDLTGEPALPRLLGVIRLDFAQEAGRLDA